jgi:hypothetical protein
VCRDAPEGRERQLLRHHRRRREGRAAQVGRCRISTAARCVARGVEPPARLGANAGCGTDSKPGRRCLIRGSSCRVSPSASSTRHPGARRRNKLSAAAGSEASDRRSTSAMLPSATANISVLAPTLVPLVWSAEPDGHPIDGFGQDAAQRLMSTPSGHRSPTFTFEYQPRRCDFGPTPTRGPQRAYQYGIPAGQRYPLVLQRILRRHTCDARSCHCPANIAAFP